MNDPRIKEIKVKIYYWDDIDKVVKKILAENERATKHLRPDFDTIEDALNQKHLSMMALAKKYNRVPRVKTRKQVIREDEINWS